MAKIVSILILCVVTFSFFSKIKSNNKCSDFRKGKFLYRETGDTSLFIIIRNDTVQYEINYYTKENISLKINWLDSCEYKLSFLNQNVNNRDQIPIEFQSVILYCKMQNFENDTCILSTFFKFRDSSKNLTGKLIKLN